MDGLQLQEGIKYKYMLHDYRIMYVARNGFVSFLVVDVRKDKQS